MRKIYGVLFVVFAFLGFVGCDNSNRTTMSLITEAITTTTEEIMTTTDNITTTVTTSETIPTTTEIITEPQTTIETFTVSFYDYDGSFIYAVEVEAGTSILETIIPTRPDYTFIGWNISLTNIQYDLSATARYELNKYTVTFLDWDGTVLSSELVEHGSDAVAPTTPHRNGYSFIAWDVDFTQITNDLTVTAVYQIIDYWVSFDLDGGTGVDSFVAHYGDVIDLSDYIPTKTDNYFVVWMKDLMPVDYQYTVIGDVTFTAIWEDVLAYFIYEELSGDIYINDYTGSRAEVVIPDTYDGKDIVRILGHVFANNTSLERVYLGSNIEIIDGQAFSFCVNLEEVIIPENNALTTIGVYAFEECTSLELINLEDCDYLQSIGFFAFYNCDELKHIFIPNTVMIMDGYIFDGCENITVLLEENYVDAMWDLYWDEGITTLIYDTVSFGRTGKLVYYQDATHNIIILSLDVGHKDVDLVIPSTIEDLPVTEIFSYAFYSSNLESVRIPASVIEIGTYAFSESTSLNTVLFETGCLLEIIRYNAFENTGLTLINLEVCTRLDQIESYVFSGCPLTRIVIPSSVTLVDDFAFINNTKLTIYCIAPSQPGGWSTLWKDVTTPVVWGYVEPI